VCYKKHRPATADLSRAGVVTSSISVERYVQHLGSIVRQLGAMPRFECAFGHKFYGITYIGVQLGWTNSGHGVSWLK
jgi:hypothetical protein